MHTTKKSSSSSSQQVLRVLQQLPNFSRARMVRVGRLGVRDGGRIKGEYCLTLA